MILKIDRKKWGVGKEGGSLKDSVTGKQCCLGFLARQCGISEENILDEGMPSGVTYDPKRNKSVWAKMLDEDAYLDSTLANQLAKANDREKVSMKKREARIKALFGKIGVNVVFTN